ncbi:LexA family protein [Methylotuvimicrobium sp.]|uniref:LexA family protein n=1 Tax=Methylotuvimicrobium sp. TaxID=2822413 RepID=UPI003D65D0F8
MLYTFHLLTEDPPMPDDSPSKRGGFRAGAGRKKGSSAYGETTRAIRVPESLIPEVTTMLAIRKRQFETVKSCSADVLVPAPRLNAVKIPLFIGKVAAGFPSPADDYIEKTLDLNDLLIKKPAATFFVRAEGESMLGAGIHPNDILIVDRSLKPVPGKILICALNGELTVKRLKKLGGEIVLAAENPAYPDIHIRENSELVIWGVVTNVIHAV